MPLYINLYLLSITKTSEVRFNMRVELNIDIPLQHMLDNIEEYFVMDCMKKKQYQQELTTEFRQLKIRINNRIKNIEEFLTIEKELYNDTDDVIVGKTQTYRFEMKDLLINIHGDMSMYPFDSQALLVQIDFQPVEFKGISIRFNLHDCKRPEDNLILCVNNGDDLNKMDIFNLYRNKKGFSYTFIEESFVTHDNNKKKQYYNYQGILLEIVLYRDPGFTYKIAILPSLILLFFSSGVNYFGDNLSQYEGLLIFFLAFLTYAQLAVQGIQKTPYITIVDKFNIVGYYLSCIQYVSILASQYPQLFFENSIVEREDPYEIHLIGFVSFILTIGIAILSSLYYMYKKIVFELIDQPNYLIYENMRRMNDCFDFNHYKCNIRGEYPKIKFAYDKIYSL